MRRAAGLTQQQLGELLELDQDRISRIERGQRPLRDIASVASGLGIPAALLAAVPECQVITMTEAAKAKVDH